FLAIKLLELDDIEQLTEGFVRIADQLKRKALLGLEVGVAFEAVAGYAEDQCVGLGERIVQVAEVLALGGAAWRAVLGIEVKDDVFAPQGGQIDGLVAGGGCGESGNRLV